MDNLWIPIIGLALLNVLFFLLLLAMARELGAILIRLGPTSVRPASDDLPVGHVVPAFEVQSLRGEVVRVAPTKMRSKVLVFLAPKCESCKQLVPGLRTLAAAYAGEATIVAISARADPREDHALAERLAPVPYAVSAETAEQLKIHATPYVILLDADNVVRAKGIANNLQHLESLFSLEIRKSADVPLSLEHFTPTSGRLP